MTMSELSELIEDAIDELAEAVRMLDHLAVTFASLKFAMVKMEDDTMIDEPGANADGKIE